MIPVLHGVWAAAGGLVGDFEHIETQTVGAGGAASVTFSSIPGTYKHLQVRGIWRTGGSLNADSWLWLEFNADSTAANYRSHALYGQGSSAVSESTASQRNISLGPQGGKTASVFAGVVIDLLDYASTSKNTTARALGGYDANGSGVITLGSVLWSNTAAVNALTLKNDSAQNFVQHSTFALYGVK